MSLSRKATILNTLGSGMAEFGAGRKNFGLGGYPLENSSVLDTNTKIHVILSCWVKIRPNPH